MLLDDGILGIHKYISLEYVRDEAGECISWDKMDKVANAKRETERQRWHDTKSRLYNIYTAHIIIP